MRDAGVGRRARGVFAKELYSREVVAAVGACEVLRIIEPGEAAVSDAKKQIGFSFTPALYHSILALHDLRHVGEACRAAFKKMDLRGMAEAVPDELVDEIAIACTPDEARDRLKQWDDLTDEALLYAPSVGVSEANLSTNHSLTFEVFGS